MVAMLSFELSIPSRLELQEILTSFSNLLQGTLLSEGRDFYSPLFTTEHDWHMVDT